MQEVDLFFKLKESIPNPTGNVLQVFLTPPDSTGEPGFLNSADQYLNGIPHTKINVSNDPKGYGTWILTATETDILQAPAALRKSVEVDGTTHQRLNPEAIQDLLIVFHFVATAPVNG